MAPKQKSSGFLCPGLRYIARPVTYRMCQNEAHPNVGCCEKCVAWEIPAEMRQQLAQMIQQASALSGVNPVQQQAIRHEYEKVRISAYYKTLHDLLNKAFTGAYQRSDHALMDKIIHPIAIYYGDVELDQAMDAGFENPSDHAQ